MADMTPLTDILNDDPATATPVQNNFQTIEAYINGTNLVRTDGTEVMTADLDMDGNTLANISTLAMNSTKITGLADGTADGDAVNYGQLTQADSPLPLGVVGVAKVTADTTGTFTTEFDVVGMTATFTAVAGRMYKATVQIQFGNGGSDSTSVYLKEGSTYLATSSTFRTYGHSTILTYVNTSSISGSKTWKVSVIGDPAPSTAQQITASATNPAFLIIEDIGLI